jgi:hypothetical protein
LGVFEPAKVARGVAVMQSLGLMPATSPPDMNTYIDFSAASGSSR